MKFTNPFKKILSTVDRESILSITNINTIRIIYKNIHGDEESCDLTDWIYQARSTNDINDITKYIIFDGNCLKYVIRVDSKKILNYTTGNLVSIDKEFINEIETKLELK